MEIPKLSVIIPVYNERDTVHAIVEKLQSVPLPMVTKSSRPRCDPGSAGGRAGVVPAWVRGGDG